ncbi:phage tail tube protein [Saccharothrix texasensis]|uniref:Tail protein n=1 Tax=Saccharothrix texasensis TaxID=103734 RepID=A0A3N1H195_9PSEU|nr:phage tail tube protein [Saccharothrix texasensis]ROP36287.1 hypothetical protein EDD40_1552 [Saccharothrix texasensis]
MTIPSGMSAQVMVGSEVTHGTAVTPNRGYEFRSESLKLEVGRIESGGIRPGVRVQRSSRWRSGRRAVAGDVTMELMTAGWGLWWKNALGGVVTSQPDEPNAPTVFLHTFTPGTLPPGLTIQVGRPDKGATVRPFTYIGCMLRQWSLSAAVNELVTFTASVIGRDATTATALASFVDAADGDPVPFTEGTLTVGGSALAVRSFSMQGVNTLADDRYFLGSPLRAKPEEAGLREITGNLEPEFDDLTAYQRFVDGDEAELVLLFQSGIIEDALRFETRITANVRFDDGTPNVDGPTMLQNPLPYKVIDDGTLSIEVEYQTTDETP